MFPYGVICDIADEIGLLHRLCFILQWELALGALRGMADRRERGVLTVLNKVRDRVTQVVVSSV
jgi:hypothetical protein